VIQVLIVDDHAMVRDGLRHILEKAPGFQVVGEAANGSSALQLARTTCPQVMLLDLSMPGRNGLEIVRQLKDERLSARAIILTMHAEHQYAERAFKAGACGYLTKESLAAELISAVNKVAAGGVYLSMRMAERFAHNLNTGGGAFPHEQLSDREFEVFRRLANGQSVGQIAVALSICSKTVSTYKMRVLEKMQIHNDAALVRYALKHELCDATEVDV